MILFETKRLRVRQYASTDADLFFSLNGDDEIMRYIRPAKSRIDSDHFFREVLKSYKDFPLFGRWAVEELNTGRFVGSFAIIPVIGMKEMQLGYSLLKQDWGRGFATELTKGGIEYFFRATDSEHLYGITEAPNIASQHVLLKAGFRFEKSYTENGKELYRYILTRRMIIENSSAAADS